MQQRKNKKILSLCATVLLLVGGSTVGIMQNTDTSQASWTADGVWHDMNEANWQNVHPRLTISAGATDAEVMQAYLNKWGSLPTVVSASGIPGTVSYEFGDRDGHGKATAIQWYATYPNGNKAAGPFTGLERQPQRPTINLPDGADMILKTPVGHPLTEQQVLAGVSAHSNNGNDTEEQLQLFVTGLDQVNWNTPGVYDVKIEAKDRYNVPTIVTRTIQVESNSQTGDSNNNNPNNTGNSSNNNNQNNGSDQSGNNKQNNGSNNSENNNNTGNNNQSNGSNNSSNNNPQTPISGISINDVITVTNSSGAPVYAINGNNVSTTGRILVPNSPWKTNQKVVINGNTYYQVSTNEWVKAEDGQLQNQTDSNNNGSNNIKGIVSVNVNNGAPVYALNNNSMSLTGRLLSNKTAWQTGQWKVIAGVTYYRVSTNEWLRANDVKLSGIEMGQKVATINKADGASVYALTGDSMSLTGRTLANRTAWLSSQRISINGTNYYQVSTNEWIISNDAILK